MAYCKRCDRSFPNYHALQQHNANSGSHWICYGCRLDFPSYNALHEHYRTSPDHYYCTLCREVFNSYSELEKHHREVHNYCTECRRGFQHQNNLQQHLNSKLHQPSNIRCPGRDCNKVFISVAALTLHFESGACPSGMTRKDVDDWVVRVDRKRIITNPDRLICGPGGYEAPSTRSWATDRSWNGVAYECFVCHCTFKTLAGLNQHLQSPVHKERIYRCPKSDCRIEFKTLSALCQHVEGGSCGVRVFKPVQDVMERLTRGINMLTF